MAFSLEDILGEFAEAQHYGQRFRSDEEHDRVYHADRRRAMAPVYEARARTRAKANLKAWGVAPPTKRAKTARERDTKARIRAKANLSAWLGPDYRAPAVPLRTRA